MKKIAYSISFFIAALVMIGCSGNAQVEIPRFPHNTDKHVTRELAVFYSPDDISAPTTLAELGYPNRLLFLLHQEHPQLKITMQTVPANRYVLDEKIRDITTIVEDSSGGICCRTLWKMIMYDDLFTPWMELGNHGYSHSPPGDSNLDHHEFSETQTECDFDHSLAGTLSYCESRFDLARNAYEEIGLDNSRIIVMRFPGFAQTDSALMALLDHGFIAFFGTGDCRETWVDLSDGGQILNIPSLSLYRFYQGELTPSFFQQCVEQGGVVNLFDHWWDMFTQDENGNYPNYQIASEALDYLEQSYGDKTWWPFGSELALWFYFRNYASVTWQYRWDGLEITADVPQWNPNWREINAAYTITMPSPKKVTRLIYSPDGTAWTTLDETMYWQDESKLYVNVPFTGHLTLVVK